MTMPALKSHDIELPKPDTVTAPLQPDNAQQAGNDFG